MTSTCELHETVPSSVPTADELMISACYPQSSLHNLETRYGFLRPGRRRFRLDELDGEGQ